MPAKILIADDSSTIQKFIRMALSSYDISIFTSSNLAEARSVLSLEKLDALIIDSCLPGVGQPSEIMDLINDYSGLSTLVLVGSFEGSSTQDLSQTGLGHILRKPFEPKVLVESLALLVPELSEKTEPPSLEKATPVSTLNLDDVDLDVGLQESHAQSNQASASAEGAVTDDKLKLLVRETVAEYCDRHFKSIAKDVIKAEINLLLDEKARHAVDN